MFERRVVVVLITVVVAALALLVRAGQVQIVEADQWRQIAEDATKRTELTAATRGRILDRKGRPLAEDVPCNDAAVAYWYVDGSYNDLTAATRGISRTHLYQEVAKPLARETTPNYASLSRREQHRAVLASLPAAKGRVERMWDTLAEVGGVSRAEIDATRREIVDRIEARHLRVVTGRYRQAMWQHIDGGADPWWRRWLTGDADDPPSVAQFQEPIAEELQPHTILADLSTDAYNALGKKQDELPGLALVAGHTRRYPAGPVAAHVVGRVAGVDREDLARDPDADDELRAYLPRDAAGRSGLELVAERDLRGTRGRVDHDLLDAAVAAGGTVVSEPVPGGDVTSTLDLDLQRALAEAFNHVQFKWPDEPGVTLSDREQWDEGPAPGAAVVIDVKTGQILAMVSAPGFDPETYTEDFYKLNNDEINHPLINRALDFAAVPGSTVKPVIGIGAITDGLIGPHETIPCDGYFRWNGIEYKDKFRCWTASMFGRFPWLQRHQTGQDKHPTPGLNPGFTPAAGDLTYADALQRSCNVFFETAAARLGEAGVNKWLSAFGLGAPLDIGLPNTAGRLPRDIEPSLRKGDYVEKRTWMAGIGQGDVEATPLQLANEAATLARDGVFVRPTLLAGNTPQALAQESDLHLDPEAVAMMHRGLQAVMRTGAGGGNAFDAELPLAIAGKTGTAQANPLTIVQRDADGEVVRDADGRRVRVTLQRSTRLRPNPLAPWYRQENLPDDPRDPKPKQSHSWFIGYAPAEDPKVAFAVFVEYGGSGSRGAGSVVPPLVEALVRHGYLEATRKPDPDAPPGRRRYLTGPKWPAASDATPAEPPPEPPVEEWPAQ